MMQMQYYREVVQGQENSSIDKKLMLQTLRWY